MDIYSFMNSYEIAEHCRSIGHEFTTLEMAFIVYLSDETLTERHKAWQWIIDTQPDIELPERHNMNHYDCLHIFLRDYMVLENHAADIFKAGEPDAVYTYTAYITEYRAHETAYYEEECNTLFPTLEAVTEAIWNENGNLGEGGDSCIEKCKIRKRWIGNDRKQVVAEATPIGIKLFGEIISVWDRAVLTEENQIELKCYGFEGMWIEVPTPRKKGAIIISSKAHNDKRFKWADR